MKKLCRICGELKNIENYHKKIGTPDNHRNECKECVKDISKKYREVDGFKEKQNLYFKKRYQENREEILEAKREYHIENREKILEKKREYRKNKENKERTKEYNFLYRTENKEKFYKYRRENPHCIAWRFILYSTLKRLDTPKQDKTINLLGYSANELKEHIEKQFQTGMTWENYGEWQIDHIHPVISFDKDTDIKIVCSLNNLRPLWATTREIDGVIYEGNLNRPKRA